MSYKSDFSSAKGWNAIDTNIKLTRSQGKSFMGELKKYGVDTIIRYYASSQRAKTVSKEEAELICENGFWFLPVYQDNARKTSDFGSKNGKSSAKNAEKFIDYIGQPDGTSILFAVDTDFTKSQIEKYVVPYFEAVKGELGHRIRIGAYGSGATMEELLERDLIEVPWLSMSRAFTGTKDFFYKKDWAMRQVPPPLTYAGSIHYDKNVMKWSPEKIGAFKLGETQSGQVSGIKRDEISSLGTYKKLSKDNWVKVK